MSTAAGHSAGPDEPSGDDATGVVADTPAVTVLDTRALGWRSANWFLPSAIRNPISVDEDGDAIISMGWLAGATSLLRPEQKGQRSRHYHRGRELYFCLGGELPFSEYASDGTEQPVTLREGSWIDRGPGGVHGGGDGPPPVSVHSIGWMMGTEDAFVGTVESQGLITELTPSGGELEQAAPEPERADDPAAIQLERPGLDGVRVVRTRELTWTAHPWLPGARHKPLSRRANGDATVSLWWLPRGKFPSPTGLPLRQHNAFREFALVLEGELRVWNYDGPDDAAGESILLRRGFWLDRRAGSTYGYEDEVASRTGVTLFHFSTRESARFVKDREKHEHWTSTLTPGIGGVIPDSDDRSRRALVARLQAELDGAAGGHLPR